MSKHRFTLPLIAIGLLLLPAALRAEIAPATPEADAPKRNCFSLHDWQGWRSPKPDQLYFRVRLHDVYLIELQGDVSFLNAPGMHLVTKSHGIDWVCNPIDLDLSLADTHMFREHLFIKAIRKLSDEEVAAIPSEFKP